MEYKQKQKKFEYFSIRKNHIARPDVFNYEWIEKYLNKMGQDGWELCAIDNTFDGDTYFYFKRTI